MNVNCIDISFWNGDNINFNKVKADGIKAVIIRAGFGNGTADKYFEINYKKAKAAGLKVGAYWFSYAESNPPEDAKREAAGCINVIKGKSFELPIYYDMELTTIAAHGRDKCTQAEINFCEAIKKHGHKAGVYANLSWFRNCLNYATLAANYSIWLAQWDGKSPVLKCDIWQTSQIGHINGISGNVDTDIIINSKFNQGDTKKDSGNADIKGVQKWLNADYKSGLVIDGIYGVMTKKALVKALQTELNRAYGAKLAVDGVFGEKTYKSIHNIKKGARGKYTEVLQGLLICHGYDTGGLDGIFGAKTESAVKAYQKARKLVVDGIAGKNTFKALCS